MENHGSPIDESSEGKEKKKATVRIVIADDHHIVRDGLKKLLLLEDDIEVIGEAGDGREVLDKVRELDPDVLLLDLRMPNLDQQANKRTRHRADGI
jgi:DNA-binding NarL/FixJ family response regulator